MQVHVLHTPDHLGRVAAADAAARMQEAIGQRGTCRLLLSTGASQFETITYLRQADIDWTRVEIFHLDEYVGMGDTHPASFVRYIRERFADGLPLKATHYLDGRLSPTALIDQITAEIRKAPIDVGLVGIGENAHIAFNDPPADFSTDAAYKVVDLIESCRLQQVGEGWFPSLDAVPTQAISMTVRQILSAAAILCCVPGQRKAQAIANTLVQDVTPDVPATILKTHPDCTIYLDRESASLTDLG